MNQELEVENDKLNKPLGWQKRCEEELFKNIFADLDREQLNEIREIVIPVEYSKRDLIFQEGALSDGIYLICEGFVVYGKKLDGRSDKKRIFKLLGPGDILGEETLFAQDLESRFGYARSLVKANLLFLEKDGLLALFQNFPCFFQNFSRNLTLHLREFERKLLHEGFHTTVERIANLLIDIKHKLKQGEDRDQSPCIKLKRETLADILGVSQGSITKSLQKLEQKDLITLENDKICIHSEKNLTNFIDR